MNVLMDFHFLRPFWLLAFIVLVILTKKFFRANSSSTGWEHLISQDLLPFLTINKQQQRSLRLPVMMAAVLAAIVILALAGPAWKKLPQPVFQNNSALIIALDLSPSMFAEDNAPSRIRRAQLKIQALLERRQEGLTALLVYAGEAHTVTPFTDDTNTISNLLPTLNPGLLPIPGSNTEMAIEFATNQLVNSGLSRASLLLVTDGVDPSAVDTITSQWDKRLSLSILGIGTDAGATIPTTDGFILDDNGEYVVAKRNSQTLEQLAASTNGYYLPLQADDSDIAFIERVIERDFAAIDNNAAVNQDQNYDQWHEFGPTLLLFFLPLLALLFRRGWLLSVCVCGPFLLGAPQNANASLWDSLWKNQDQRGHQAWQAEDYPQAEKLFSNKQWQGSAAYNNENYETALEAFKNDSSAEGYFNQGNALANLSRLEEAIDAYDKALSLRPDFKAAQENKRYLEELQNQNEQQSQNDADNSSDEDASDNNSDSKDDSQTPEDQDSPANGEQSEQSEQDQPQDSRESQNNEGETEPQQDQEQTKDNNALEQIPLPDDLTQEQQQAMQQWLRKIPDDPSGLLRRKFEYEFDKRRQLYQQGQWELPKNNAHQRY